MNKKEYVSFGVAKLLRKKEFDWPCMFIYTNEGTIRKMLDYVRQNEPDDEDDECLCPTQQMACRWLREVHNADIWVKPQTGILGVKAYTPYITTYKLRTKGHMYYHEDEPDRYDSKDHFIPVPDDKGLIPAHQHYSKYEEAIEAAIEYVLKNLI